MIFKRIAAWLTAFFQPRPRASIPTSYGPYVRSNVQTPNEREFHERLRQACPAPQWEVWPQVAMTALVTTRKTPGHTNGWTDFNKIQARRLDWVLACRGEPLLVIELDDRTHDPRADTARDQILSGCGWPVIRFDSRSKPTVQEIAQAIAAITRRIPV